MQASPLLLAFAVWKLFPHVQLDGGYAEDGSFSYDFLFEQEPAAEMIPLIETEMAMLAREPCEAKEMAKNAAVEYYRHHGQFRLAELVGEEPGNILGMIQVGKMLLPFEGSWECGYYKILKLERLDERTRIYGAAARDRKALKGVKWVDHRDLAEELGYFKHGEEGFLWLPRGSFVKRRIEQWYWEAHRGFDPVIGDHEAIFEADVREEARYAELKSSEQSHPSRLGLGSILPQTKDLATIFCSEKQAAEEVKSSLQFMIKTSKLFGFEPKVVLKGSSAELRKGLEGIPFDDERAFDGSAIVMKPMGMKLSLERKQKTVVLSRSLFDSIECLIALLLEKNDGVLPRWLEWEQVRLLPVKAEAYAAKVRQRLQEAGIRVQIDGRDEPLAAKIRRAEMEKVPVIAVAGAEEEKTNTIALRDKGEVKKGVTLETLIQEFDV